jgi:hypothetical protein
MVGREVARSARYTSACVLPDPTGPEKPEYLDWHEPCMCRSRRPSLMSSKRPQRVPWWQGKKRPEGVYWPQNSLADSGIRPSGGLPGAPNAPTKPPLPESPKCPGLHRPARRDGHRPAQGTRTLLRHDDRSAVDREGRAVSSGTNCSIRCPRFTTSRLRSCEFGHAGAFQSGSSPC